VYPYTSTKINKQGFFNIAIAAFTADAEKIPQKQVKYTYLCNRFTYKNGLSQNIEFSYSPLNI